VAENRAKQQITTRQVMYHLRCITDTCF
jgi:hypothetical protein